MGFVQKFLSFGAVALGSVAYCSVCMAEDSLPRFVCPASSDIVVSTNSSGNVVFTLEGYHVTSANIHTSVTPTSARRFYFEEFNIMNTTVEQDFVSGMYLDMYAKSNIECTYQFGKGTEDALLNIVSFQPDYNYTGTAFNLPTSCDEAYCQAWQCSAGNGTCHCDPRDSLSINPTPEEEAAVREQTCYAEQDIYGAY